MPLGKAFFQLLNYTFLPTHSLLKPAFYLFSEIADKNYQSNIIQKFSHKITSL